MGAGVFLIGDIALLIVSDKAGHHYTELLLTGDNQSSHKQTKTSHHNICTNTNQHNCRVITTSAPPLLRPVLLLGRSSGVTIATVFCRSHLGAILITRERIIILVLVSSSCCCNQGCGV